MPVAYSYIRMSRPEQLRGDSLRRQLEAARKWAVGRGIELDEGLRDIGVSAYRGKNRTEGALGAFLSMVEDGRVARGSYLVMESLDRLSREAVVEALPRFMDIVNAGVTIVTLIDGQEYSKARLIDQGQPGEGTVDRLGPIGGGDLDDQCDAPGRPQPTEAGLAEALQQGGER
ncbi:recombinase family protein [Methylobacterium pseudosasicola]|uniref:Resolvase, N terminal domain n=1 Tax=Methylobacterium pseudosasicola TaxID=582667 RepID=A0A1I4PS50_9HYPH|nr:recombinase family protein [Methylobacterium pseudosasicola]SFM30692.1 Resolvase, N terminal domain [Methylobacterium pseudosasicola]